MRVSGRRLIREQAGFTLVEMMVTMMVMIVVLFALYNIFDSSVRVFSFGNNKVEAVENARLGLEKMEREVRAAYPVNKAGGDPQVLSSWTAKRVTFGNDLDGNGRIECVSGGTPCERITYDVYQPAGGSTYALGRANSVSGGMEPVVEFIDYTDTNNTGLSFKYYEKNGTTEIVPGSGDESKIAVVQVELKVKKEGASQDATQVLATDIALRNRVGSIAPASAGVVAPVCSDSSDNDGDGKIDFGADPGCSSTSDTDETDPPACSDGRDNDTDGKTDFGSGLGNDPGCSNANDIDETDPTPPAANRPPKANADSLTVDQNKSITFDVVNGNTAGVVKDTDADNDPITVQSNTALTSTEPNANNRGTLTRSGDSFTYNAANGNSARGTVTFTYTITDGKGGTDNATVTIRIT